ncbi:MAG TPA: hypothetical protein VIS74_08445, partial [Chthoniobacterales bacterium]
MFSSVLLGPPHSLPDVFGEDALAGMRRHSCLSEPFIDPENLAAHADQLAGAEVIFSTWGMPKMDEA